MIPAGFWRRYTAWSLDAAIVGVPIALVAWPYWHAGLQRVAAAFDAVATRFAELAIEGLRSAEHPLLLAQAWLQDAALRHAMAGVEGATIDVLQPAAIAFVCAAALYWIAFESSRWQATPGKRALDLLVTDARAERLGLLRAIARHAAGAVSWLTLNLGHALAALPPRHLALHDRISGTRVLQQTGARTQLPAWALAWLLVQLCAFVAANGWALCVLQVDLQRALERAL